MNDQFNKYSEINPYIKGSNEKGSTDSYFLADTYEFCATCKSSENNNHRLFIDMILKSCSSKVERFNKIKEMRNH